MNVENQLKQTQPLDGRIKLNSIELKALRKKLGYSQEKLAHQCCEQYLLISIATIKRVIIWLVFMEYLANNLWVNRLPTSASDLFNRGVG